MKNFYILLITILLSYSMQAQQDVFSRSDVTTGNFGDGQLPWFYASSLNIQGDPDNGDTTRNFVKIGHNNNTTMLTNGRFYRVATLDFEVGTTSPRTINNAGGGISASGGIYNASSATHTFNTPIGIDGPLIQIHANSSGGFVFTDNIFINANTVQFGNLGTGDITVSGTMQGTGNVQKIGANTLIIAGSHTYSGTTTVSEGTLRLQGNLPNSDVTVLSGATLEIDANITVQSITVEAGGNIEVNSGQILTLTNDMSLQSSSTSYSSLILNGTITGTVNYERHVNLFTGTTGGGNDLISAPLSGQTWASFITSGTNAADLLDDGNTSPTAYAFAPFDKTAVPADFVNFTDATSATLESGLGYRAATDAGTTLTFTGTPLTGLEETEISNGGSGFELWNLIGNPYPSYISALDFLNHNINNNAVLNASAGAIYGYNGQASNKYDIINLSTVSGPGNDVLIAPGQGFFVASGVPVGNIQFTTEGSPSAPDMRRTDGGDDFISGRTPPNQNLELLLSANLNSFKTDFYFNENSSLGLDPGYDAKLFGDNAPAFSIYSHLVEDNTGLAMGIQSLGNTDLADISIALGVNANQGEQLTFSISENTLAATVEVYLDDSVANTTTLLNTADYVITPSANLSGTGRFFLRFSDSALSTTDSEFDTLSIYSNSVNKTVVIAGQLLEATTAQLYDLQGRLVSKTLLEMDKTNQSIDVSNLSTGVYVVQLTSTSLRQSQKIIIR